MITCLVSPVSRRKPNGERSPKDYPGWEELCIQLRRKGCHITQVAADGDERLQNINALYTGSPLDRVITLAAEASIWISVDNFLPHAVYSVYGETRPGVVLWGPSDPEIFGYPANLNILRSKGCLCGNQFGLWRDVTYDATRFMPPFCVICSMIEHGFLEK